MGEADATADKLAAAHRALVADGDVQLQLPPVPPDPPPPAWLKSFGEWLERALRPVGRFLRWISAHMPDAPVARILLWTMLAVIAAGLIWLLWRELRGRRWWRRRRAIDPDAGVELAGPSTAQARAWLEQADALAAEGRFADAVHHLLMRSVEDISGRRPQLVRPAMTSRDLARASAIPGEARRLFASLAATVERSLFGGGPVGADDWARCREGYARFAASQAWTG